MPEKLLKVETYSGYRADERPVRIHFKGASKAVAAVEDRWYSPGATFFKVRLEDGDLFVLRREEAQDTWSISAFRRPRRASDSLWS